MKAIIPFLLICFMSALSYSATTQTQPPPQKVKTFDDISPMNRNESSVDPNVITGDNPHRNHSVIWNKPTLIAGLPGGVLPAPSEAVDFLFIGGGMANLVAALEVIQNSPTKVKIMFLETGDRFGGNSQAEVWNGLTMASGAAYIAQPTKGSLHEKFLQKLGIFSELKSIDTASDPVFLFRKNNDNTNSIVRYDDFWNKGTAPGTQNQFNQIRDLFKDMIENKNGKIYPEIPAPTVEHRKYVESLDTITVYDYLKKHLNAELHPDLETILSYYSRSAFGAGIRTISAAAGLNFLVGDSNGIASFPGGNGRIAEIIFKKISEVLPLENLRTQSTVFDIQASKDKEHAQASYMGPDGVVRTISAKHIISSTAPFILTRLIDDIEPERANAIQKMKYRPYLVANVLLKRNEKDKTDAGYDLIFGDPKDQLPAGKDVNVTDVVMGVSGKNDKHRMLTLYMPGDEFSVHKWISKKLDKFKEAIMAELNAKILPPLGYTKESVEAIRVALHGHAIPVAAPGNLVTPKDGLAVVDQLQKPYRNRVFFVGQAMWGLPSWESVVDSSVNVVQGILQQKNKCQALFGK